MGNENSNPAMILRNGDVMYCGTDATGTKATTMNMYLSNSSRRHRVDNIQGWPKNERPFSFKSDEQDKLHDDDDNEENLTAITMLLTGCTDASPPPPRAVAVSDMSTSPDPSLADACEQSQSYQAPRHQQQQQQEHRQENEQLRRCRRRSSHQCQRQHLINNCSKSSIEPRLGKTDRLLQQAAALEAQGCLGSAFKTYQKVLTRLMHGKYHADFERTRIMSQTHYKVGVLLWKRGLYPSSLVELQQAIAASRLYFEQNEQQKRIRASSIDAVTKDLFTAEIYLALGKTYLSLGRRKKCKVTLQRALTFLEYEFNVDEQALDEQQQRKNKSIQAKDAETKLVVARILHMLGQVHGACGEMATALDCLQDTIRLQEEVLGESHVDIAATLASFGLLLEKMGDPARALDSFVGAYCVYQEQALNEQNTSSRTSTLVDMGVTLSQIGWAHYLLGQYDISQATLHDALARLRPLLGENHRNIASVLVQIGMVFTAQGEVCQALTAYKEALKIQRAALGDDHEDVALTLSLSGHGLLQIGRVEKAILFVERALAVRVRKFGATHMLVAETLVQLGNIHQEIGNFSRAKQLYKATSRIYEAQNVPEDHAGAMQLQSVLMELNLVTAAASPSSVTQPILDKQRMLCTLSAPVVSVDDSN